MSDFETSPLERPNPALLDYTPLLAKLPEKTFTRLISLAARLLNVPYALVSLNDREKPYLKIYRGFTAGQAEIALAATPAIMDAPLIVPDVLQDERFKDNPLVTAAPSIRFFAAVPLRTGDVNLGTLALFDQEPRTITLEQQDELTELVALALEPLEASLNDWLTRQREEHYRTLARNFPNSAVYMFDRDLRYTLAEGSLLSREQTGFAKEDLEGKTLWEALLPEYAVKLAPIYQKALLGQETVIERNFGGRSYLIHTLPARTETGELHGGLVLTQDITERKQGEERLQTNETRYHELYMRASRQAQELALLHKVRNTLSGQMDLPRLFKTVAEAMFQELGYQSIALSIIEGDTLHLKYQIGYPVAFVELPVSQGICGRVVRTGQAAFVENITTDPDYVGYKDQPVSIICIPLFDQDQVVGSLSVQGSLEKPLTEADFELLKALGEYVSLAIHRSRLYTDIHEQEERLQTVIRNAPVILNTFDTNGVLTLSEGKGLAALNFQPGQLVGQSVFEIFKDNPAIVNSVRRAVTGETFSEFMEEGGLAFESYFTPVKNEKGEITSVIAVSINITEKKAAEKALQAERDFALQVMRNMGQGLTVFRPDFTIEYANPAFARMGGYAVEEVVGKSPSELLPPDLQTKPSPLPWQLLGKQSVTLETELVRKDGSQFYAHIITEPIYRDGELAGIVGVISDLTEQKKIEQKLRLALEKEKELSEMKNKLISTASHEFRTPLSAIISSTELLEYYHHRFSDEKKSEILGRISQSANRLTRLVEDILTYNRAEDGKLECKRARLDLSILCKNLVDNCQLTAEDNRTIRLTESGPKQEAYLDEKLLTYILQNLLSNAVKYTTPGGQVELAVEWRDGEVVLRVKDDGIGIPLKDQPGLFEPFQRASNAGMVSGTGFGLAIVKRSVLVHGGTINIDSAEGQGTTFTVTLPLTDTNNGGYQPNNIPDLEALVAEPEPAFEKITDQRWLLEQAIESSSSGYSISDPRQHDNPIVYVNKGFELLTGFLKEEVIGKNGRFLEGADHDQPALEELRRAVAEEKECRLVLRNYHKDGHLIWVELHVFPVRNRAGKVLYFVGIQNDVSDRVRAEAALNQGEKKFNALVENSPDMVARYDRQLRFLYINPSLDKLTNGELAPERVLGKSIEEVEFMARRMPGFKEHLTKVFQTGQATSFVFSPNLPGEEIDFYQVRIVPEFGSDDNEVVSVLTISRNVTDLKWPEPGHLAVRL